MMNRLVVMAAAMVGLSALATDMDHKAKTLRTVRTVRSGLAEVTCNDPGDWIFEVAASDDAGRDVVTVRLTSPTNAVPPAFGVFYRVSGAGVQNVWTSNCGEKGDGQHLWPQLWWGGRSRYSSQLASQTPIAVGYNATGVSPVALACSEAMEAVTFGLYADDRTCEIVGRCEFFGGHALARTSYEVKVLLDRRGGCWSETVTACSDWVARQNGFDPADVPELAYAPLYSTWYAYLQDVNAEPLEREARLAAELGMKTMILDDGWQKVDSRTFYSACGDWMPVKSRFPDMRAHVDAVHRAGLKYMLWLAVPFMGDETKNYARFRDKLLRAGGGGTLDPRFPEVREYLITTYERVIRDWDFDGVKLDFIDSFVIWPGERDPAERDGFAGRDYRSLPEAVNRLMKDILARLKAIKPDVLVEFRQSYMGTAIRQYGNMIRAADCPADPVANRKRIADLRLTSGRTAVHSDMLVWSRDETPEGAAVPILNALFGVVQYSMILDTVRADHKAVIRAWIDFSRTHREALLKGAFRPHHPENAYPWIEGESAAERIVAVYSADVCADCGAADRPVLVVNATQTDAVLVELRAKPTRIELFDTLGRPAGTGRAEKGLVRLAVPKSGYAKVVW